MEFQYIKCVALPSAAVVPWLEQTFSIHQVAQSVFYQVSYHNQQHIARHYIFNNTSVMPAYGIVDPANLAKWYITFPALPLCVHKFITVLSTDVTALLTDTWTLSRFCNRMFTFPSGPLIQTISFEFTSAVFVILLLGWSHLR